MEDQHLINVFERDQRRRGLAESTIASRSSALRLLMRWLKGKPLLQLDREDINLFLDSRELSARARSRWLSDLHVLYAFAVDEGLIDDDPTARIQRPKLPKLLPRPIGTVDLNTAIAFAPRTIKAMLLLAAYEGMRCIEIAQLVREDVLDTMEPPAIIARGKGAKSRVLPLHPDVWEALQSLPMPRSGPVFRHPNGKPVRPWMVSHTGNGYLHDLGMDATMHKLRHWFGTGVYRTSGHNLLMVRDLLGHSVVTTCEGYAAYDRSGTADAVYQLTTRGTVSDAS